MTTSLTGIDMIKRYEGLRLIAYKCAANKWTIGYGHTAGVVEGDICTAEQAEQWLMQDIIKAEKSVMALERWGYVFSQFQFDALVSFTFNCGAGNLAKLADGGKRTLLDMSEKILQYNKAGGRVVNGLIKRRKEESEMLKDFGEVVKAPEVQIGPCIFKSIATRRNYNIRETPDIGGKILGNTNNITVTQLIAATAGYIQTEHGWISRQAFYDTFN